jgi:4-diphosphocytidyl-2-C-methyl-D-erythritol kinase
VLVLALALPLSTAEVYREADRLGLARGAEELERLRAELLARAAEPLAGPLGNDLQAAALSLCPPIAAELERARGAGAGWTLVSGSGPTALGLFAEPEHARAAAACLEGRAPAAVCAVPVDGEFARAVTL